MSADTNTIIRKDITLVELVDYLKTQYKDVAVYITSFDYFFQIGFVDGEDKRLLSCFFNSYAKNNYGIEGVFLSLSLCNNSIKIMKGICKYFGGYIIENDCGDEWYVINLEKFESAKETTSLDEFKNKCVSELGYDKLNIALELFEEYKNIKGLYNSSKILYTRKK